MIPCTFLIILRAVMFKIYLVEGKSLIVLVKKLVSYMFLDEDLLVGETGINTEKKLSLWSTYSCYQYIA